MESVNLFRLICNSTKISVLVFFVYITYPKQNIISVPKLLFFYLDMDMAFAARVEPPPPHHIETIGPPPGEIHSSIQIL